jgi:hypothetical protein
MGGEKLIKFESKMTPKNRSKKQLKNQFSRGGSTGLKMCTIDVGGAGPQFKDFLKF